MKIFFSHVHAPRRFCLVYVLRVLLVLALLLAHGAVAVDITWIEVYPVNGGDPYDDPNVTWSAVASDDDGSNLIAAVNGGRLYTSSNSGTNWTERQPAGDGAKGWTAVASDSDGSHLIAAINGSRVYISTDSGDNWAETQPAGAINKNWQVVASDSDGSVLMASVNGVSGEFYLSIDGGANWTEQAPSGTLPFEPFLPMRYDTQAIASDADGSHLIAGQYGNRLYISTDSGANWTETQPAGNNNKNWQDVASDSDGSNLIAVVYGGRFYVSSNGGAAWTEPQGSQDLGNKNWVSVASDATGTNLVAVISGGRMYTSSDGGVTWTEPEGSQLLGDVNWVSVASDSDASNLLVASNGAGGRIYTGTIPLNSAPSAPALVSPSNASATNDSTPTLSASYTDADSADVGTTNYRIASSSLADCVTNTSVVASGTSSETADENENTTWTPGSSIGADGTYYWCAQNNDGTETSSWASMGSFTLDTAVATPSNFSPATAATITDSTPTITFDLNENGDCRASTTDETYVNMSDNTDCTGDGTQSISCTLADLGADGTKNVYIACNDTAGNADTADTSEALSFTLDTATPLFSSLAAAVTENGATLTWTTNETASTQVEYGRTEAYGTTTTETDTDTRVTSHSVTLTNLACGTTYNYRVKGTDSYAQAGTSSGTYFHTQDCAAPPPGNDSSPAGGTSASEPGTTISSEQGKIVKGLRIITARPKAKIGITARPVDNDQMKSLKFIIGKKSYPLKPVKENSPVYRVILPGLSVGSYRYTLTADYGTLTLSEKGVIQVRKPSVKTAVKAAVQKIVQQVAGVMK